MTWPEYPASNQSVDKVWCDYCKRAVNCSCGIRSCPIMVDLRPDRLKKAEGQFAVDTNR